MSRLVRSFFQHSNGFLFSASAVRELPRNYTRLRHLTKAIILNI